MGWALRVFLGEIIKRQTVIPSSLLRDGFDGGFVGGDFFFPRSVGPGGRGEWPSQSRFAPPDDARKDR